MSSHKNDIHNVEKVFSKAEETLDKVEEAMPQLTARVSLPCVEPLKQVARWYLDTAEDFANYGFALQESGISWAKDTPWAHLFGIQASIGRKLIANSTKMTRTLWQFLNHF